VFVWYGPDLRVREPRSGISSAESWKSTTRSCRRELRADQVRERERDLLRPA
jgi:hypothetical protein